MEIGRHWDEIRNLFEEAFKTSLHYAMATVNEDGSPHVAPVGSLVLGDNNKGVYFEKYLRGTPANLKRDKRVCVLAVISSKPALIKSLFQGRFSVPPAVKLIGTVGERREATEEEIRLFRKRVGSFRMLKGYGLLWGDVKYVREIHFSSFEPVDCGSMTRGAWTD